MSIGILRLTLIFSLTFTSLTLLHSSCIDSLHLTVKPVQCFGLRNGVIEISEIFGGKSPYYFSLDGKSYSTRPVFDLLWAGEYVLYVRDSTGCEQSYPVLVTQPEELRVQLSIDDPSVIAGTWAQVTATVYPPDTKLADISWRPPALFATPFQLVQSVRIMEDTDLAIEIRNEHGCIARDNLPVVVEQTNLYFPNVFDPGSKQDNYFTLHAGEGVSRIMQLQVFDRAGNLVFEKRDFQPNDPQSGWNGKWQGRQAPPGVYPWVAQVEFLDGNRKRFSGGVTLIAE